MPQLLPDVNQTLRLLGATFVTGTYAGTTTDVGYFAFPHYAPFTPTKVFYSTELQGGGNQALPMLFSVDATYVTLFFCAVLGSAADLAVSGSYRVEA